MADTEGKRLNSKRKPGSQNGAIRAFELFAGIAISCWAVAGPNVSAQTAADAELHLPLQCKFGTSCFIQQYFDHDPGSGRQDYKCGNLVSNGHDGIDFRVQQNAGEVAVLASADGTVLRTRDGMADGSIREGSSVAASRMAGNGVVIDHGRFSTQYSHLRLGSIVVRPGQKVTFGQRIGAVGLSGNTEYMHLHFSVRRGEAAIDPFTGGNERVPCGQPIQSMWTREALRQLAYTPSGVAEAGFTGDRLSDAAARAGSSGPPAAVSPALVFWVDAFGTHSGDREHFVIRGPSGQVILDRSNTLARDSLIWFSFAGLPRSGVRWPPGAYTGTYSLFRKGQLLGSINRKVAIGDEGR